MSGKFWLVYATASTSASGSLFLSLSQKPQLGSPFIRRRHLSCSPFSRSAVSRAVPKDQKAVSSLCQLVLNRDVSPHWGQARTAVTRSVLVSSPDGGHGFGVERVGAGVIQGSGEGRLVVLLHGVAGKAIGVETGRVVWILRVVVADEGIVLDRHGAEVVDLFALRTDQVREGVRRHGGSPGNVDARKLLGP